MEEQFKMPDVDLDDLEGQCAALPGQVAYIGNLHAQAERNVANVKLATKAVEARLYQQMRTLLESTGDGRRVTEAMVDNAVVTSAVYQEAYERLADAELQTQQLRATLEALRCKRDMLVSIGAGRRAEAHAGIPVGR